MNDIREKIRKYNWLFFGAAFFGTSMLFPPTGLLFAYVFSLITGINTNNLTYGLCHVIVALMLVYILAPLGVWAQDLSYEKKNIEETSINDIPKEKDVLIESRFEILDL